MSNDIERGTYYCVSVYGTNLISPMDIVGFLIRQLIYE